MKTKLIALITAVSLIGTTAVGTDANAGCVTGAVVGGVAGHLAHHHTLMGAAAGCVIGHELAVRKKKQRQAEHAAWVAAHRH